MPVLLVLESSLFLCLIEFVWECVGKTVIVFSDKSMPWLAILESTKPSVLSSVTFGGLCWIRTPGNLWWPVQSVPEVKLFIRLCSWHSCQFGVPKLSPSLPPRSGRPLLRPWKPQSAGLPVMTPSPMVRPRGQINTWCEPFAALPPPTHVHGVTIFSGWSMPTTLSPVLPLDYLLLRHHWAINHLITYLFSSQARK